MMCADDGESDVTSFSMVFAGENKQHSSIGPFRVSNYVSIYLEFELQDIRLDFSAIACRLLLQTVLRKDLDCFLSSYSSFWNR